MISATTLRNSFLTTYKCQRTEVHENGSITTTSDNQQTSFLIATKHPTCGDGHRTNCVESLQWQKPHARLQPPLDKTSPAKTSGRAAWKAWRTGSSSSRPGRPQAAGRPEKPFEKAWKNPLVCPAGPRKGPSQCSPPIDLVPVKRNQR